MLEDLSAVPSDDFRLPCPPVPKQSGRGPRYAHASGSERTSPCHEHGLRHSGSKFLEDSEVNNILSWIPSQGK